MRRPQARTRAPRRLCRARFELALAHDAQALGLSVEALRAVRHKEDAAIDRNLERARAWSKANRARANANRAKSRQRCKERRQGDPAFDEKAWKAAQAESEQG